ncbi:hypothetical protein BJ085DRAFT_32237 [Dimargaris cristalligena]|uniref:Uncharacterized protein n=1 Tax=Dimargaris cristalligena TaxID=215637 RepID=A0A4P9ZMK2_9FUNG|nr:hypothetical protein BJ085DRAFT_32237 [Dimargaris cristalligena]|eukprot:RKP33752.1 hypothetical protein BJ085DRAFT_32237 [Dimargaris cristalligena]
MAEPSPPSPKRARHKVDVSPNTISEVLNRLAQTRAPGPATAASTRRAAPNQTSVPMDPVPTTGRPKQPHWALAMKTPSTPRSTRRPAQSTVFTVQTPLENLRDAERNNTENGTDSTRPKPSIPQSAESPIVGRTHSSPTNLQPTMEIDPNDRSSVVVRLNSESSTKRAFSHTPSTLLKSLSETLVKEHPAENSPAAIQTPPAKEGDNYRTPPPPKQTPGGPQTSHTPQTRPRTTNDANLKTILRSAARPTIGGPRTPGRLTNTTSKPNAPLPPASNHIRLLRSRLSSQAVQRTRSVTQMYRAGTTPQPTPGQPPPTGLSAPNAEETPQGLLRLLSRVPSNRPTTPQKLPVVTQAPKTNHRGPTSRYSTSSVAFGEESEDQGSSNTLNSDSAPLPVPSTTTTAGATSATPWRASRSFLPPTGARLLPATENRRRAPAGRYSEFELEYPDLDLDSPDPSASTNSKLTPNRRAQSSSRGTRPSTASAFSRYSRFSLGSTEELSFFNAESMLDPSMDASTTGQSSVPLSVLLPMALSSTNTTPTSSSPHITTAATPLGSKPDSPAQLPTPATNNESPGIIMAHTQSPGRSYDPLPGLDYRLPTKGADGGSGDNDDGDGLNLGPDLDYEVTFEEFDTADASRRRRLDERMSMHSIQFTPGAILAERDFSQIDFNPEFSPANMSEYPLTGEEDSESPMIANSRPSATTNNPEPASMDEPIRPLDSFDSPTHVSAHGAGSAETPPARAVSVFEFPDTMALDQLTDAGTPTGQPASPSRSRSPLPLSSPAPDLTDGQKDPLPPRLTATAGLPPLPRPLGRDRTDRADRTTVLEEDVVAVLRDQQQLLPPRQHQCQVDALVMQHLPMELVHEVFQATRATDQSQLTSPSSTSP